MTTHRDTFIDMLPTGGMFLTGMARQGLIDQARDGIDALAALYFMEYEDDTLPVDLIDINTFLTEMTGEEAPLVAEALEGGEDE